MNSQIILFCFIERWNYHWRRLNKQSISLERTTSAIFIKRKKKNLLRKNQRKDKWAKRKRANTLIRVYKRKKTKKFTSTVKVKKTLESGKAHQYKNYLKKKMKKMRKNNNNSRKYNDKSKKSQGVTHRMNIKGSNSLHNCHLKRMLFWQKKRWCIGKYKEELRWWIGK